MHSRKIQTLNIILILVILSLGALLFSSCCSAALGLDHVTWHHGKDCPIRFDTTAGEQERDVYQPTFTAGEGGIIDGESFTGLKIYIEDLPGLDVETYDFWYKKTVNTGMGWNAKVYSPSAADGYVQLIVQNNSSKTLQPRIAVQNY